MRYKDNSSLKYHGVKVLILDGNLAQALPLIKHFNKLGCEVSVLCGSKLDAGYATKYTHHRILAKINYSNEDSIKELILRIIRDEKFDVVFPLIDIYANILSKNKSEFSRYSTIYVNDYDVFIKAFDKRQTMKICMENNIPCPKTFEFDKIDELSQLNKYPFVIKPVSGNGAKGFSIAYNFENLKKNYNATTERFGPVLVQEYIQQTKRQFQVEMLIDKKGECKLFVLMDKVRWYPLNGGSSTLNITLHNRTIMDNCVKLLKILNWRGYASLDIIEDPADGLFKIMEINPRMNGTCKICFASGVDLASSLLEDAFDENVVSRLDYKDDVRLRVFFKDFLWFLKSKNRFRAKPSWFSNKNTCDEFISFDDPRVGFRYFLSCFKRIKNDKKNRF